MRAKSRLSEPRSLMAALAVSSDSLQRLGDIGVAEFEEGVADGVGGDLARQFPDGVPPHAVGHHQEMAVLAPDFGVGADADRERILIITAAKANIADGRIADRLIPAHPVHLIRGRFGK